MSATLIDHVDGVSWSQVETLLLQFTSVVSDAFKTLTLVAFRHSLMNSKLDYLDDVL